MNTKRITSTLLAALFAAAPLLASPYPIDDDQRDRDRERAEAKAERESDLYDDATDAMDDREWAQAAKMFRKVADMKMEHAEASLFWLSRAQNELGQRADALATLGELRKTYPASRWTEDSKALEVEIRQSSGQRVDPAQLGDDDVKLMALNGLMNSDPEKAVPILERILDGNSSSRVKERAVFVLSQANTQRSMEVLGRIARDTSHRNVQEAAVKYLGIMGGEGSRKVLADVYASTPDVKVKRNILRSYMISGDRVRLVTLAKAEPNDELRGEAVRQLGIIGAKDELAELYRSEKSPSIRKSVIQSLFISNAITPLADIARSEPNPELRTVAIRNLGLLRSAQTGPLLKTIYYGDASREIRQAVISALFLQNDAKALVAIAREEKDPELKREAVSKLSIMRSPEATDFLMEVLK